jgi:hypothetical protein
MGLFSWINEVLNPKKIQMNHPYFGRLEFTTGKNIHDETYGFWSGELITPLSEYPLGITIDVGPEGPNDEHRARYETLIDKFPNLSAAISEILFQEWIETRKAIREYGDRIDEGNEFNKPEAMADVFKLVSINLSNHGGYELSYIFRNQSIWPDLQLYLSVESNWEVTLSGGAD